MKMPDKRTWVTRQLFNDTTGSYPRRSIAEIFISGLHRITFPIYIILFNSNSAWAEVLQLV